MRTLQQLMKGRTPSARYGSTLLSRAASSRDPDLGDSVSFYRIYRDWQSYADRYDRTGTGWDMGHPQDAVGLANQQTAMSDPAIFTNPLPNPFQDFGRRLDTDIGGNERIFQLIEKLGIDFFPAS